MKMQSVAENSTRSFKYNKYIYTLYILLSVWLFIKGDYDWAFANMGIALVFDPFDPSVKWNDRPLYQRLWLVLHLFVTLSGLAYILFLKK